MTSIKFNLPATVTPRHNPAGLFFCLASSEGAGLLFCPAAMQPHTSVSSGISAVNANYTVTTLKPFTGLYSGFSIDLTRSSAHNTAITQDDYAPSAPRWRASQRRSTSSIYQTPPRRTLYGSAKPPIIIRYIRVQRCALLWIHARQCSKSQTVPARRGQRLHLYRVSPAAFNLAPGQQSGRAGSAWHTPPGGAVQRQGYGGRRGTIDGYRRISFRAFAR